MSVPALWFDAPALRRFLACPHALAQDLAAGEIARRAALGAKDEARTKAAMAAGEAEILDARLGAQQGPITLSGQARLLRQDTPSRLGQYSYAILGHATEVFDWVALSEGLEAIQGFAPQTVTLLDGRVIRLEAYRHYVAQARARLAEFATTQAPTRPKPCSECQTCRWAKDCTALWQREDSLYTMPSLAAPHVKRLQAAGVTTVTALATLDRPVRGITTSTQARITAQARHKVARKSGPPSFELRPLMPAKGLSMLPAPCDDDLYYIASGPKRLPPQLHSLRHQGGCWQIAAQPAPDQALEALLARLRPSLDDAGHIYHFGAEALQNLRNLCTQTGTGEPLLDRLLRERRFVDLSAIARAAVISSEASFALADLEAHFGPLSPPRPTGDMADLADYDTRALQALHLWLHQLRPADLPPYTRPEGDTAEKEAQEDEKAAELRALLAASGLPQDRQQMLFDLGMFHQRELKPAQWAVFDSQSQEEDELADNLDTLAGLQAVAATEPVKRSFAREYTYPAQETKLRAGKSATLPSPNGGAPQTVNILAMDRRARRITLKVGPGKADLLADRLTLHPDWPLDTKVIAAALRDVIEDQCSGASYHALDDLLARRPPRLTHAALEDVTAGKDPVQATVDAVLAMDQTVLPLQGPPGTGKTYVTAQAILALLRQGKRVGVASNSHEAVRNVLMGTLSAAEDADLPLMLDLVHKVSGSDDGYPEGVAVRRTTNNDEAAEGRQVVGGTAFFFARPENVGAFDWLFVDEAGQVGLANLAAMGRAAKNLVLVGDPRQLPQVIQGAHPAPANLSCLEWLLGDAATFAPERGIFLPISRRMHPQVCDFISGQVYEGRLRDHPDTANQAVLGTSYPATGAYFIKTPHDDNTQISSEEVEAILASCHTLLGGTWRDKTGATRPMTPADIIVVAPYNAQVNALADALPAGIRVGTVDKFQGQEAPVCLISMTASSAEDSARGLEFLLSRNRLNVAVSRAKALALVFGTPRLRETQCESLTQIELVNTLCALPDLP